MEKNRRQNLRNMMINRIVIFIVLIFSSIMFGQQKIIQDFNMDKVKDTLYYKCDKFVNTQGQPFCEVEIKIGKCNKKYNFKVYYVNFPIIDECGSGCILIYDDAGDTEYSQEFNYSKKYNDWILTKDEELLKYENDKTVNLLSKKYLLGISGKKYLLNKKTK
ncbi:hypothetical protein [Chryseobacterium sp. YIM B08800]|uniref:hypothetical protein n=1 Tax=Chryseobacterium sp. YIM B08800 TaxID=2984136 RepID=UPI00223F6C2A|nr:hypothetical protein [Chryseobacterium sp. YIM B08800]